MTIAERKGTVNVVTVNRADDHIVAGQETARGMGVIFRHFRKALFGRPNRDRDDVLGQFNVQYPEERLELPEASRNMPILLYDDATGQELCTSCFQCERVCPPQVIHITQAKDPNTGKPVPAASGFIIEYDACMACGYCAEVCPFDAIKMDHDYELSTANHPELDVDYDRLLRPVSYYAAIAPNMWDEVKDTAYKKLQNNIKRRPGMIGRDHGQPVPGAAAAPAARAAAPAAGPAAAAAPTAAAAASAAAPAAQRAPVAAIGTNMSEDKVARLQAIRAAKRAASGGPPAGGPPPDTAHAVAASVAVEPDTAQVAPADQATPGATPGQATGPVAAIGTNMTEDKIERLKAIREANRAKRGG